MENTETIKKDILEKIEKDELMYGIETAEELYDTLLFMGTEGVNREISTELYDDFTS